MADGTPAVHFRSSCLSALIEVKEIRTINFVGKTETFLR